MNAKRKPVPGANAGGWHRGTPPEPEPLRPYDLERMAEEEPPEPDWVVEDMGARGEVTHIWGPPGVGKSMLVEALCGGVGHGRPVAGLTCKRGRVLYLDAENGEYEVHRRVRNLDLPVDGVAIYDASTTRIHKDFEHIGDVIRWEAPDLLVIDSLRRMTVGLDENESGAMAVVIAKLKEWAQQYRLAVLLIHHANKSGVAERGSSAIKDQVSISWEMGRANTVDGEVRRLHNDKMRIAAEPDDMWLRIEWSDGVRILAAEEPSEHELASGKRGNVKQRILAALDGKQGTRAAVAREIRKNPKDGTLRRAFADLEDAGLISQNGDGRYRRTPTGASNGASGESVAPAGGGA